MQEVHKGITKSGVYGYFTGNCLAYSLTEKQYNMSDSEHEIFARDVAFKYVVEVN